MNLLYLIKNWTYARIIVPIRYKLFSKKLSIKNSSDTLDYILKNKCSVSRYGDYEYMSINEESNNFQSANHKASERLKEILVSDMPNHIVCIPYAFKSVNHYTKRVKEFWQHYVVKYYNNILSVTRKDKQYYDASFTRFYMDAKEKSFVPEYITRLKKIWDKRDVLIVEGEATRFGVGNDLLQNANSVQRILCPATNAFDKYEIILSSAINHSNKNHLILCALGMTATVLAYDLAKKGFQAIDIGHADIEYSWWKKGATTKILIEGKAVNELGVNSAADSKDKDYISQIIEKIN